MDSASVQGIVIASFELGALVGALACLDIGDRLGRRLTVWFGMLFMLVGGVLQTSAWAISQLTLGRVISGIGLGLQVATVPSWQSECAKAHTRGRWGKHTSPQALDLSPLVSCCGLDELDS
jgi:MFS family permease